MAIGWQESMTDRRQKLMKGIGAAFGCLLLLLSAVATPLALAASEPEFCSMECCVADGHCCCAARKPFVEGQVPGADGQPVFSENALTKACPAECARQVSSFHHLQIAKAAIVKFSGEDQGARLLYAHSPRFAHDTCDDSSAPRAPPATLL
jgi:hypothetical protein